MLNIFYNKKALNDTLVIEINKIYNTIKTVNNCTVGYDNEQISFINIPHISHKYDLVEGYLQPTEQIIQIVKVETNIDLKPFIYEYPLIVGNVIACQPIKDSHLHICDVDVGQNNILKIVCGAANVKKDIKVVVAMLGATIPNGLSIKRSKLLGYESQGMLCSARELNLQDKFKGSGIIILTDKYITGTPFTDAFNN